MQSVHFFKYSNNHRGLKSYKLKFNYLTTSNFTMQLVKVTTSFFRTY